MASAAVMYCTQKVGWAWTGLPSWVTPMNVIGYGIFALICILPALNTFWRAWTMKAVGGGTRGETFVASLLSFACPLLLGAKNSNWDLHKLMSGESGWINGIGTLVYLIYLGMFIYYADQNARWTIVLAWIPLGSLYLILSLFFGLPSESTVVLEWLCTISVLGSWCIPLLLAFFVMEKDVGNLPDRLSTAVGLLYSIVWFHRSWGPKDYHGLGQNLVGVGCCVVFLVLPTLWTRNEPAGHQGEADQGDLTQQLIAAREHIIEVEEQQGGHRLELPGAVDPLQVLPLAVDPPQVLDPAVGPPQVLAPAVNQPPVVAPVGNPPPVVAPAGNPPPVVAPAGNPPPVDPPPVLPVGEPPPVLPVNEPQPVVVQPPELVDPEPDDN